MENGPHNSRHPGGSSPKIRLLKWDVEMMLLPRVNGKHAGALGPLKGPDMILAHTSFAIVCTPVHQPE